VRLQIFLDEKRFGPGFIDGKPGQFTTKAVHAYNRSVGRIPDDWTALMEEVEKNLGETYALAIVPDIATQWVNPSLPTSYSAQAKQKRMSYRSYLEFMAERYHTSETFLAELNGSAVANGLKPRSAIQVPNIAPFLIEELAEGRTHKAEDILSTRTVVIDTKGRNLFIYERGEAPAVPGAAVVVSEKDEDFEPQRLIAMFPITPGKVQFIHHGQWAIANCFELPSWRYDKQLLETGRRSKDPNQVLQIPPGPNLPVGILWSGLTKAGIGIHGTASPRTIGRSLLRAGLVVRSQSGEDDAVVFEAFELVDASVGDGEFTRLRLFVHDGDVAQFAVVGEHGVVDAALPQDGDPVRRQALNADQLVQ
jgi:lipoprotein-anchoring transpeptidase ErfK/SrfK